MTDGLVVYAGTPRCLISLNGLRCAYLRRDGGGDLCMVLLYRDESPYPLYFRDDYECLNAMQSVQDMISRVAAFDRHSRVRSHIDQQDRITQWSINSGEET